MEVADTEAAVTLVGAISAAATSLALTSAEAGPICTLAGRMCTLVGPILASPETVASGMTAAVGLAGMGVMADMVPATRTGGFIRPATGRNELKPMGVLNGHLASHESSHLFTPMMVAQPAPGCATITSGRRKRSLHPQMHRCGSNFSSRFRFVAFCCARQAS
jgi:hypothetical protein